MKKIKIFYFFTLALGLCAFIAPGIKAGTTERKNNMNIEQKEALYTPQEQTKTEFLLYTEPTEEETDALPTEEPMEQETEQVTEALEPETTTSVWWGGIVEGDAQFILLCNCVGHEAGAYWIPVEDKAKVVEVILNWIECDEGEFRSINSIRDALSSDMRFSGCTSYNDLVHYTEKVTEEVKEAVRGYLSGMYPNHGYKYFWGDGYENHFSQEWHGK